MPVIRHRTGPLAGQEQTVDQSLERITFGRDASVCEVVFPADLTLVARRHFALLRRPSGEWTFDDFGKPYVAINGVPAEVSQSVDSGDLITLGQPGGPSFEFISGGKDLGGALPVTAVQHKVESSYTTASKTRRFATLALLLALVVAGGAAGYSYWASREGAKLEQAVAELAESQRKAASDSIGPAVRDKLVQGAYLVGTLFPSGQMVPNGTAFPIGPDMLGTNAHVAILFNELKDGQKLFVRAPGASGKIFQVLSVELHPGYTAFPNFLNEDPMFVTTTRDCTACVPVQLKTTTSYDVAIMRVAPGSNMSPVIEIASRADLEALGPGMPVGTAGYPTERISGGEVQGVVATPNLRTGMINAMTDMFHMPGDANHRRLITHNVPLTGGASGSAMLNAAGKLVGLVNAINPIMMEGGRMPNAAIINYGQRADLLLDLMEGKAEAVVKEDRPYWAKQTANFARGSEYLAPWLAEQLKPKGSTAQVAAEFKAQLTKGDSFTAKDASGKDTSRRQKIHPVSVKANVPGLFVAYGKGRGIQLYVVVDGKIVAQDNRDGYTLARVPYNAVDRDLTGEVYVVGGDEDVDYTLVHYSFTGSPS